jgi:hypothetical protein
MTAEELHAFVLEVRAEATARLDRLDAVDPTLLPPALRVEFEEMRSRWQEMLAMTEDHAVALHEAACEAAGRELTPAEARALLVRH